LLVGCGGELVETNSANAREQAKVIGGDDKKEETSHNWKENGGFLAGNRLDHTAKTFDDKFGEVLQWTGDFLDMAGGNKSKKDQNARDNPGCYKCICDWQRANAANCFCC